MKKRAKFVEVSIEKTADGLRFVVNGEDISEHVAGYSVKQHRGGVPPEVELRLRATVGGVKFASAHLGLNVEEMVDAAARARAKHLAEKVISQAAAKLAASPDSVRILELLTAYIAQDSGR